MEFLVFLLLMIFVVVNDRKNKQKKGAAAAAPAPAREKPAARMKRKAAPTPAAAFVPETPSSVEAVPHPEDADEEGCLGGSMDHTQHEGESRAEHARHMAAIHSREAAEAEAENTAHTLSNLNRGRMRQAVVMAEVLGRPKALRGRAR